MPEKFEFEAFNRKDKAQPEVERSVLTELARQAQESFAANDFGAVLDTLTQLKEKALPESERSPEGIRELKEARELFGEDFLGVEEIEKFTGRKLKEEEKRQVAKMWTEKVREQKLTKPDLERLKKEGFMVILRTAMLSHEGKEIPANVENLRKKFKNLFYNQDWYDDEKFAKEGAVRMAWAIVKKEVLEESRSKDWDDQEEVLKQWAKEHKVDPKFVTRRMAAEVAYDILAYYNARNERILEKDWDRTGARSSGGYFVLVGFFGSVGLSVSDGDRSNSLSYLGVCPSR
jgi:hypothetical protein